MPKTFIRGLLLLTFGFVAGQTSAMAQPNIDCSVTRIRQARAKASALATQGKSAQAIAVLEKLEEGSPGGCILYDVESEEGTREVTAYGWLLSDLALLEYRAGKFQACHQRVLLAQDPHASMLHGILYIEGGSAPKLKRALEHNGKLCQDAFRESVKKEFGFLKPGFCFEQSCLKFAVLPEVPEFSPRPCPPVIAYSTRDKNEIRLKTEEGPLADLSFCCNLKTISAGIREGKRLIRVQAKESGSCDGAHSAELSDAVYEWKGASELKLLKNLTISSY